MKFPNQGIALLLVALTVGGSACGKKPEPITTPATPAISGVSVEGTTEAAVPPPTKDAPTAASAPAADDTNTVQAPGTLPGPEVLLRAIGIYNKNYGRPPATVDDLIRAGLMSKLPTLDASLKYKVDLQAGTLEIINK